jgi:Chemoreceptor zinc-binding domain
MDFNQAIAAHSGWKMKLSNYLNKPDHSLKPAEVALDSQCELGKWIAGEGAKYAKLAEFTKLKTEHSHFHKAAADVVRRADAGQNVSQEVLLGAHSEFTAASTSVVQAIMAMKSKA